MLMIMEATHVLKHAIDEVILTRYNIPNERYIKIFACVFANAVSVDIGKYKVIYTLFSF